MVDLAQQITMLQWYPPTWNRRPPGMIWDDWQAWGPWLQGPGAQWSEYSYDVELLTEAMLPGETDPKIVKMWLRNTAKRIDAIGERDGRIDMFEARRYTGWSAIAQLIGYRDLWLFNFPSIKLGNLYLITERIDDVHRSSAARQGITTWVVGEPSP